MRTHHHYVLFDTRTAWWIRFLLPPPSTASPAVSSCQLTHGKDILTIIFWSLSSKTGDKWQQFWVTTILLFNHISRQDEGYSFPLSFSASELMKAFKPFENCVVTGRLEAVFQKKSWGHYHSVIQQIVIPPLSSSHIRFLSLKVIQALLNKQWPKKERTSRSGGVWSR